MATPIDASALHGAEVVDQVLLIPIGDIEVGERLRAVDPVHAQALGLAMARDGQKVSIQVCRLPGSTKWRLVDGAHRLAGAEMVGIPALRAEVTSANREERRLREIWAQLGHKGLSDPIDRAAFIAELVQIKRAGAGLAEAKHRAASVHTDKRAIGEEADLTLDTMSNVYGWSEEVGEQLGFAGRTIRRDLLIYRRIAPSLIEQLRAARYPVARNAAQLRALAKFSPERQALIVANLLGGAKTVAEAMTFGSPQPEADPADKRFNAALNLIKRMSAVERAGLFESEQFHQLAPAEARRLLAPMLKRGDGANATTLAEEVAMAAQDGARDQAGLGRHGGPARAGRVHADPRGDSRGQQGAGEHVDGVALAGEPSRHGGTARRAGRAADGLAPPAADEVNQAINDAFTFFLELDKWDPDASIGMVGEELRKARDSIQLACFALNSRPGGQA